MNSRLSNFISALLGAGVIALVVIGLSLGGAFDGGNAGSSQEPAGDSEASASSAPADLTDVSSLYDRVSNGVVFVQVGSDEPAGLLGLDQPKGSGSGFVLDEKGNILTNQHVVADADEVSVRVGEADELVPARVMGTDPGTDLAVVQVDPEKVEGGLEPLELGASDDVEVGQPAVAIGSPFGLRGSLTTGVISALDRPIRAPNDFTIDGALQTDAAINPGNSGGPLLDARGRVIGINAQIATDSQSNSGVGFAIPVDTAKDVVPELRRGEKIDRAYLGVSTTDAPNGDPGALVVEIRPGSPAAEAGFERGDVITGVAGKEVGESADVAEVITSKRPGERIEVNVRRGGDEESLNVELGKRPESAGP